MSALTTWKPCTLIIHGGAKLSRGNTRLFLNLRCLFDSWVRMYAVSQCWHQDTGTLFIFFMVRNQWKGSEEAISSQVPFSPPFFFHIVRCYSSYDPLELHPGGQIQGAGRGDLLILAMQALITQRGRERAIFKPQRHKGGDQLADFWLYYSITGCEAEISFSNACKWMRFTGWSEFSYVLLIILPLNHCLG